MFLKVFNLINLIFKFISESHALFLFIYDLSYLFCAKFRVCLCIAVWFLAVSLADVLWPTLNNS